MSSHTPRTDPAVTQLQSDQDVVRELLGPAADMPAPPSPDDRTEPESEPTGGIIPGTGRRAEDHEPFPEGNRGPGA